MLRSFHLFLTCLLVGVRANRVYPPTKVIKLTLGISKATYLPFQTTRFIKDGQIIENPSATKLRFFIIIPMPPKYDPAQDKISCSTRGWTAKSYENKETEVLMFKNVQQKLVVFGFRGTEPTSLSDWLKNLNVYSTKSTINGATFTTHRGFAHRYGFIASWFEREYSAVPRDYTIVLTGHSLGGAEATIAAVYAAGKLKRKPDAVVTYGSPLVGVQDFKNYYNQVVGCDRTIRMAAKGDPFTNVPNVNDYTHVCDQEKVDGNTGYNPLKAHKLHIGYEEGIRRKYSNVNEINLGCDQMLY